jgi:hypothetical protein
LVGGDFQRVVESARSYDCCASRFKNALDVEQDDKFVLDDKNTLAGKRCDARRRRIRYICDGWRAFVPRERQLLRNLPALEPTPSGRRTLPLEREVPPSVGILSFK